MSKLKVYHHELRHNEYAEFCLKYEVDKVIAEKDAEIVELKQALHDAEMAKDDAEAANTEYRLDIEKLKAENERLMNWPHTDNSAVIANLLEELSSTKRTLWLSRRSLWLSRADRARCTWKYYAEFLVFPRQAEMKRWKKVEQLCRAKAEEYK